MSLRILGLAAAGLIAAGPALAQTAATAGGSLQTPLGASATSAGAATAGVTSAATWGTGTTLDAPAAGVGGIALGGHAQEKTHMSADGLSGTARAQSVDHGTFSKSRSRTSVQDGAISTSSTSMAHVPGSKPVRSTTTVETQPPPR